MVGVTRTRAQAGALACRSGKTFERKLAAKFREVFPHLTVRRASQAERAHNPDLFFESDGAEVPTHVSVLWLELNHARSADPIAKLHQAERDTTVRGYRTPANPGGRNALRHPVVLWKDKAKRSVWATMRAETLRWLLGDASGAHPERSVHGLVPVTITLDDFMQVLVVRTPADLGIGEVV